MKYYSDKLDKIFDTAADLTAEELEYDKRVAEPRQKQKRKSRNAKREKQSAPRHLMRLNQHISIILSLKTLMSRSIIQVLR